MKQLYKLFGLLMAMAFTFIVTSCASVPGKLSEGKEKMEDNGYEVMELSADDISDLFGEMFDLGVKTGMICEKESSDDFLIVIWFETSENAEDFTVLFKLSREYLEKMLNAGKDDDEKIETKYEAKGEVAYYGTVDACADFLG